MPVPAYGTHFCAGEFFKTILLFYARWAWLTTFLSLKTWSHTSCPAFVTWLFFWGTLGIGAHPNSAVGITSAKAVSAWLIASNCYRALYTKPPHESGSARANRNLLLRYCSSQYGNGIPLITARFRKHIDWSQFGTFELFPTSWFPTFKQLVLWKLLLQNGELS